MNGKAPTHYPTQPGLHVPAKRLVEIICVGRFPGTPGLFMFSQWTLGQAELRRDRRKNHQRHRKSLHRPALPSSSGGSGGGRGQPPERVGEVSGEQPVTDTSQVGVLAADLMEQLAEQYEDEDIEIGTVAVVVEISKPDEGGETGWTAVQYRCSDWRAWVQTGFFHAALRAVESSAEPVDEDEL
jgi:hypothetical protein